MNTIAFATGLGADEQAAFTTAIALAAASDAKLVTVHACTGAPMTEVPRADEMAARWGLPLQSEVMLHTCCDDPADTLLDALRQVAPDLVVVGTHGRDGLSQILTESVSESVARNVAVPTLFVPLHGKGLANHATGAIDVHRIVIPAGDAEATRVSLEAVAWLARAVGAERVEVVLLHVADGTPPPVLGPIPEGLEIVRKEARGGLEEAISEGVQGFEACAVVMATRGHDGILDALRGSHTEHVVRGARCPVLSVPIPDRTP